jgi:hypothetical protein
MEPEYNGMLALVEGTTTSTVDEGTDEPLEETMIYDSSLIVPASASFARSTLQRYTDIGWHTVWESDESQGLPTRVMVSEASDSYRLWWGYGSSMYTQVLRRTFHNPRQGAQIGIDRFASTGYLRTGQFDANLSSFMKLASHVEVHIDDASVGTVEVWYRYDAGSGDSGWMLLGSVSSPGANFLSFDQNADGFYEGLGFRDIEFEYRLSGPGGDEATIVNWAALYFTPIPLQGRSWRILVPLDITLDWVGRGAREIADQLDSLTTTQEFARFSHRDATYRVRVAQTQGDEATGDNFMGSRVVTLVEVRDRVSD